MSEWINVSDRIPDHGQDVIAFGKDSVGDNALTIATAFRFGPWDLNDSGEPLYATHWMPLPEPPEV